MLGLSLNDLWSTGVRRFLRPTGLVSALVGVYRAIVSDLDYFVNVVDKRPPAAHGKLTKLITLDLKNISSTTTVAGSDVLISGGTVKASDPLPETSETFPYMLCGATDGIISFSKSIDGATAYLYADFVYHSGVYYFKTDPRKFGVINTSGGTPTISFITANYKDSTTTFQDIDAKYNGSGNYAINEQIANRDASAGILASAGKLALESCGVETSLKPETLSRVWTEGGVLCAESIDGKLLLDSIAEDEVDSYDVAAGKPLTNEIFELCRIYPYEDVLYCFTSEDGQLDADSSYLSEAAPVSVAGATASVVNTSDVSSELTNNGYITVVRINNHPDYKTQNAIDNRLGKFSSQYLVNFIDVTDCPEPEEYNIVYVYYTSATAKAEQPLVYPGISPRNALYGNFPTFGVLRIPVQGFTTKPMAITDNGTVYNKCLSCGDWIKAVSFVYNSSVEQTAEKDVIVYHKQIPEVVVGAGGSAVLRFS